MRNYLKKILAEVIVISLVLMGIPARPHLNASNSLEDARVIISDSKPNATGVEYKFEFTAASTSDTILITFPSEYTDKLNNATATCSAGGTCTVSTTTATVTCSGTYNPTNFTVTVSNVTNPNKAPGNEGKADVYKIIIETKEGGTTKEKSTVTAAIVEGVIVTATVDAILKFTISGVSSTETVKATTTSVTTTATAIPFGTLPLTPTSVTAAQELSVETNASEGFTVVVFQDGNLRSAAGDEISCFKDGTCVEYTNAASNPWTSPSGTLDNRNTYGHFGFTSADNSLGPNCGQNYYGDNGWAGFNATNSAEVMCHNGPADGKTENKGKTWVLYKVEITALQPAGEYTNTLTYIATPTY